MPLRGPGLLLLLLLHSLRAETQEMEVGVTVGSDCLLSCVYPKRLQFNLDEVYVYWQIRESTVVMVHIPQKNSTSEVDGRYRDRAHLFPQNMEQGNFSLLLRNVTPQDTQRFTCLVFRREQGNMKAILKATVTLRVAANFSVPVVNSSSTRQDQELTFMCTSTNGYPRPNVYWVNKTDDTVLDRALHNDTVSLNERGLYDVVSVLRVPWAPGVSVGCCIENVLLRQNLTGSGPEGETSFPISLLQRAPPVEIWTVSRRIQATRVGRVTWPSTSSSLSCCWGQHSWAYSASSVAVEAVQVPRLWCRSRSSQTSSLPRMGTGRLRAAPQGTSEAAWRWTRSGLWATGTSSCRPCMSHLRTGAAGHW